MNTNSWITVCCTTFLAMLIVSGFFFYLYKKERDKKEDRFKEDLMKKLDVIGLSTREKEIQQKVMVDGKSSQEIADDLFIEKSTVDTHRKNINVKFKKAKIKKQYIINL